MSRVRRCGSCINNGNSEYKTPLYSWLSNSNSDNGGLLHGGRRENYSVLHVREANVRIEGGPQVPGCCIAQWPVLATGQPIEAPFSPDRTPPLMRPRAGVEATSARSIYGMLSARPRTATPFPSSSALLEVDASTDTGRVFSSLFSPSTPPVLLLWLPIGLFYTFFFCNSMSTLAL